MSTPAETRILDKTTLAPFIAGRKVIAVVHYALTRRGSVSLHILEDGGIAAEVANAAVLDARAVEEVGKIIAKEQAARGIRVTLDAVAK